MAQTLVVCSRAFTERLSESELKRSLCPQMQVNEDSLEDNLARLVRDSRERGNAKALSAAAVIIR